MILRTITVTIRKKVLTRKPTATQRRYFTAETLFHPHAQKPFAALLAGDSAVLDAMDDD